MTDTIHDIAESMLDTAIEADEWDEIPMLFVMADSDSEQGYAMFIFGIADGHPGEFMEKLAQTAFLGALPDEMLPESKVLGIALQNEAWGVRADTKADGKAVQAYTANGQMLVDHPDRVEMKVSVSYDGTNMQWHQYQRGAESKDELPGERVEGRIPDALRALFTALNNRPPRT